MLAHRSRMHASVPSPFDASCDLEPRFPSMKARSFPCSRARDENAVICTYSLHCEDGRMTTAPVLFLYPIDLELQSSNPSCSHLGLIRCRGWPCNLADFGGEVFGFNVRFPIARREGASLTVARSCDRVDRSLLLSSLSHPVRFTCIIRLQNIPKIRLSCPDYCSSCL